MVPSDCVVPGSAAAGRLVPEAEGSGMAAGAGSDKSTGCSTGSILGRGMEPSIGEGCGGGAGSAGRGSTGSGLAGTGLAGAGLAGTGLAGAGLAGAGLAGIGLTGAGVEGGGLVFVGA